MRFVFGKKDNYFDANRDCEILARRNFNGRKHDSYGNTKGNK